LGKNKQLPSLYSLAHRSELLRQYFNEYGLVSSFGEKEANADLLMNELEILLIILKIDFIL
jgi:hypothetical protein